MKKISFKELKATLVNHNLYGTGEDIKAVIVFKGEEDIEARSFVTSSTQKIFKIEGMTMYGTSIDRSQKMVPLHRNISDIDYCYIVEA